LLLIVLEEGVLPVLQFPFQVAPNFARARMDLTFQKSDNIC